MVTGPLDRLGAALEWLVYGPQAVLYRRFVFAVLVATATLAVVNALVVADLLVVGSGLADALWAAGSIAVALFALTAIVQLVVLARSYERGTAAVAETAAELESAAAEVEATAEELETTAESVETAAAEVETAAGQVKAVADETENPPASATVEETADDAASVAEEVRSEAADAKATTETAKESASELKDVVESERDRLPADVDEPDQDEEA